MGDMETGGERAISFRSVIPALVFAATLNGAYAFGSPRIKQAVLSAGMVWWALFLAFPLAHVIVKRGSLRDLGYRGPDPLRLYARGVAVGAVWRLADVLIGYWGLFDFLGGPAGSGPSSLGWGQFALSLLGTLTIAPLFEDTFFRAYLQVGLEEKVGVAGAITVQALLFATHPGHASQGVHRVPSIFLFGLIAGVLYWRTRSIVPLFGAHGWANALTGIVPLVGRWVYG